MLRRGMMKTMMRTYTELISIPNFLDRYRYLKIGGTVGKETFGVDRYFNQKFYRTSKEWRSVRNRVIARDLGCDLAIPDKPIVNGEKIFVHHMNPIMLRDIMDWSDILINEEYLITTTLDTHNAIHYGDESLLLMDSLIVRFPNDTCPWRQS